MAHLKFVHCSICKFYQKIQRETRYTRFKLLYDMHAELQEGSVLITESTLKCIRNQGGEMDK